MHFTVGFHLFPIPPDQSQILFCHFSANTSVVCTSRGCLSPLFYVCCLSFPLPVKKSKYEPKSQEFSPHSICYFDSFSFLSINCISSCVQKHPHRLRPARYLVDGLAACRSRCHLFCFSDRAKATGQIPALQTTLWEEEEEGGQRGL